MPANSLRHPYRIFDSAERRKLILSFLCYALCLIPLASYICFYNLGEKSFGVPDEVSHIQATQGMALSGHYFQPTIGKKRYFNKPPFKMWLSLVPVHFMGESNFSYRFLDGLLGIITTATVFSAGFVLFRSWTPGFFAALALLGCRSYVFTHGIRGAVQDGMLMTLTTLAMMIGWLLLREFYVDEAPTNSKRRRLLLAVAFGSTIGCAVYTKTVAGFLAIMMLATFVILSAKLLLIVRELLREGIIAAVLSLAIPATYFVPHLLFTKGAAQIMLGHEVVQRATEGLHNQHNPWFYLIRLIPDRAAVPPELLLVALLIATGEIIRRRNPRFLFLFVWALFPLIFFSLIPSRLTWYMAPGFPGMALLVGFFAWHCWRSFLALFQTWIHGSQISLLRMASFGALSFYCSGILVLHLLIVGKSVAKPQDRISLDLVTEQLLRIPRTVPLYVVNEPSYSYREQAYRNMLERRAQKFGSLEDLIDSAAKSPRGVILTEAKNLYSLLGRLPISRYALIRSSEQRRQWLGVFELGDTPPLRETRPVSRTIYFGSPEFRALYGFEEPTLVNQRGVRLGSGKEQAFLIEEDWPANRLGERMNLVLGAPMVATKLTVLVNAHPVFETILSTSSGSDITNLEWTVPAGIFQAGQNTIHFQSSAADDSADLPPLAFEKLSLSLNFAAAP